MSVCDRTSAHNKRAPNDRPKPIGIDKTRPVAQLKTHKTTVYDPLALHTMPAQTASRSLTDRGIRYSA